MSMSHNAFPRPRNHYAEAVTEIEELWTVAERQGFKKLKSTTVFFNDPSKNPVELPSVLPEGVIFKPVSVRKVDSVTVAELASEAYGPSNLVKLDGVLVDAINHAPYFFEGDDQEPSRIYTITFGVELPPTIYQALNFGELMDKGIKFGDI